MLATSPSHRYEMKATWTSDKRHKRHHRFMLSVLCLGVQEPFKLKTPTWRTRPTVCNGMLKASTTCTNYSGSNLMYAPSLYFAPDGYTPILRRLRNGYTEIHPSERSMRGMNGEVCSCLHVLDRNPLELIKHAWTLITLTRHDEKLFAVPNVHLTIIRCHDSGRNQQIFFV